MRSVILSACSTVSPYGIGWEAFRNGYLAKQATSSVAQDAYTVPFKAASDLLGRKGTRSIDRATTLSIAAIDCLFKENSIAYNRLNRENTGIVIGTINGSLNSTMSFTRDSLSSIKPFLVDPSKFPNTVMNCAATRSAIWHKLSGPNVTVSSGRSSSIVALNYGRRLILSGRANAVIIGGTEEFSPDRSLVRPGDQLSPLGEGAVVFLLEGKETVRSSFAKFSLEIVAIETTFVNDEKENEYSIEYILSRALCPNNSELGPIKAYSSCFGASDEAKKLDRKVGAFFEIFQPSAPPIRVDCTSLIGDTYASDAGFHLASLIAEIENEPNVEDHLICVCSGEPSSMLICTLFRVLPLDRKNA